MASSVDVSLVVCTYTVDRLEALRALLRSVDRAIPGPRETIVVVDRDRPLARRLAIELGSSRIEVMFSPIGGNSAARNVGWQVAKGSWIAFVDDDAVVAPDWLGRLLEVATRTGADIVGGRIDPIWPSGKPPTWYSDRIGWVVGCSYDGLPEEAAEVDRVISCNMLVRRKMLEATGGFDSQIGRRGNLLGSEDTELCIRAGRNGAKIFYTPSARVWQVAPPERTRLHYALRRSWAEGRSKAALERLHQRALGAERLYSRLLLGDVFGHLAFGMRWHDRRAAARGVTLAAVFTTTVLGYVSQRARAWLSD